VESEEMALKDIELKLIAELIRNSRRSDRELAKALGVSQPTVSRIRVRLEKQGLIDYSAVPNLAKLGFEIFAITYGKWKQEMVSDQKIGAAQAFLSRHPNMIFVSTGTGLGFDRVTMSFHKSYSDYSQFIKELKEEWTPFLGDPQTFIVSLSSDNILRNLTFKYLVEQVKKESAH
jgi:DNA-binding Lrp family transcriptional regulator